MNLKGKSFFYDEKKSLTLKKVIIGKNEESKMKNIK